MLNVKIRSYDPHFKTFHISVQEQTLDVPEPVESLIPEILLPYIAPGLVAQLGGYELIGQEFNLALPISSS
jgi:hypothetical protein